MEPGSTCGDSRQPVAAARGGAARRSGAIRARAACCESPGLPRGGHPVALGRMIGRRGQSNGAETPLAFGAEFRGFVLLADGDRIDSSMVTEVTTPGEV